MIVAAGVFVGEEIGAGVAVEGELADLFGGRVQSCVDGRGYGRFHRLCRLRDDQWGRNAKEQYRESETVRALHGSLRSEK